MIKRLLFIAAFFGAVLFNPATAQLLVTNNTNATQLAQRLAGTGVKVFNATYSGNGGSAGTFSNGLGGGQLGINAGVVMSTGLISSIPSNATVFASAGFVGPGDADLNAIAGGTTNDATILEFDLVPLGNVLRFRYQFGSEEYPEYTCSEFNDAFAFLVSGNIPGGGVYNKRNVATLVDPFGNTVPVAINTVNQGFASPNYNNSGCQSIAFADSFVNNRFGPASVYDGYTKPLFAEIAVIPCDTYHFKLVIADVIDDDWDSGVFLEGSSFISQTPQFVTGDYDNGFTTAFEGCSGGFFVVSVAEFATSSTPITYTITGTGSNGVDYPFIPDTSYINAGSSSVIIYVNPVEDGVTEGTELVTLTIYDQCTGDPIDSVTLAINDKPLDTAYALTTVLCSTDTIQLVAEGGGSYRWFPSTGFLSPDTAKSPLAVITGPITYNAEITLGSCVDTHSVPIDIQPLSVVASVFPNIPICPGTDVFLTADPDGGQEPYTYDWSPGHVMDDSTVQVAHGYPTETTTFTVIVTDANGCSGSASVTVQVDSTPTLLLGPDVVVCPENLPQTLTVPGGPFDSFLWSTGDTTQSISVSAAGSYTVTVTRDACVIPSDTLEVIVFTPASPALSDTGFCPGSSVTLSADPAYTNIQWNTAETTITIVVTAVGDYYYTGTDANGCTVTSDTATVSLFAIPNVGITASDDTICPNQTAILDAGADTTGVTILWSTGDTTATITATGPGVYIVTVTDSLCSASDTIEIFGYQNPQPLVVSDTLVCEGQSATFNLINGPFVSYVWSTGDTGVTSITVSTPGTYNVTVNDGNCDWVSNDAVLGNFPTPQPSLSDTGACLGETVILSAEPGLVNIVWSTGDTTQTIAVTTAGTFYYTASDVNGCNAVSDTVDVTFQNPPALNITSSDDTICPGSSAILTAVAAGTNLTYLWQPGGETDSSIVVTAAGIYSVRVRDDFCASFDTIEIFEYTHAPITLGNDTTVCPFQPVELIPSGGPYLTYVWSTTETTPTITVALPDVYTVTVNDGVCDWPSLPFTLSNYTVVNPVLPDTGACVNDSVILSAEPGYTNVLWSTGETTTSISILTPGDYSYTATDLNGCAVQSDTSTVTFTTAPTSNAAASVDTICPGGSTLLSANAVGTAVTYLWSPGGQTTDTITVNAAGTYIVQINDGYCVIFDTVEVFEYTHAPVSIGNDTTICPGATVVLSPTGGPYVSYNWSTTETTPTITVSLPGTYSVTVNDGNCDWVSNTVTIGNSTVSNPALPDTGACTGQSVTLNTAGGLTNIVWSTGDTTASITVSANGDYSYTATDANGCSVVSDTSTVTFNDAPTVNLTSTEDTICPGTTATLSANAVGSNLTYTWLPGNETTPAITVNAAGQYIVTVDNGFCPTSDTITIAEFTHAPISIGNDTTICNGNSLVLSPTGSPYVSYNWSTTETTPTITVSTPGTYSVTVNDGNCDWVSNTITVSQSSTSNPALPDTGTCQGGQIVLNTVGGLSNITWSTGSNATSITVTADGNYSYTATDAGGCVITSDTSTVTFTAAPVVNITASPDDTICSGGGATLTANSTGSNLTYNWQPGGATSQSITATQGGTYYVTVSEGFCTGTDSINIAIRPAVTVTVSNDTTVCPGSSVTVSVNGTYASYLWSNGSTTATITTSTAGPYSVLVSDGICSYASDTFLLSNTQVINAIVQGAGPVCDGQSVTLTATPGLTNYTWSNTATGSSITVTQAGQYSYTATDPSGCTVTSNTVSVNEGTTPVLDMSATPPAICAGTSTTLNAGSEGDVTYVWQPGNITAPTISVNQPGTYYVTATLGGCSASDSIVVQAIQGPQINLNPLTVGCCQAVVLNPAPGNASYQWSDGSTSETVTITNTTGGPVNLSVTVTNASGCSATGSTSVVISCINATASAEPDSVTVGDSTQLTVVTSNDTTSSYTYVWGPEGTLTGSTTQNPIAAPTEVTTYTVTVTDPETGCVDTASVTVYTIAGEEFVVPSAFTPNGDGHNDEFYPVLLGSFQQVTEFRIYNRWGAMVHNSTTPWNGEFNGQQQPAGTFIYYIVVRVPDSQQQGATKDYNVNGSVTLLR